MDAEYPFETVMFTLTNEMQNQVLLNQLRQSIELQEIRVIDIRRYQDQLVVTFRRLKS